MQTSKVRTYLEVATNVAVLLLATVLLSTFAVRYFAGSDSNRAVTGGLQKGQQIASINGLDYKSSSHTLLIAMNTQCGYCTASIPFYNKLAELKPNGKVVRIVTAFPNPSEHVQRYVQEHQLRLEAKNSVDLRQFKIAATPTMILINDSGLIEDFWVGELNAESQEKILKSLSSL